MKAIYKNEIHSYFRTMTGYALFAFLVMFIGIYFMVYNMYQGYPYFSYTLSAVMTILLVWIPVLTMRSFAEERKNKTDQLLFTAPVKIRHIVMGKYLAMSTIFLMPVIFLCLFPLIIEMSGTAYLLADYIAIIQFFLVGCVFIAIGMFFSSITESPVIAAVSTFAVILILYIWEYLIGYLPESAAGNFIIALLLCTAVSAWVFFTTKNKFLSGLVMFITAVACTVTFIIKSSAYESLFSNVLGKFNVISAFENAVSNSIFDVSGTILQITVIGVFIFLTIQSIEKRRWS